TNRYHRSRRPSTPGTRPYRQRHATRRRARRHDEPAQPEPSIVDLRWLRPALAVSTGTRVHAQRMDDRATRDDDGRAFRAGMPRPRRRAGPAAVHPIPGMAAMTAIAALAIRPQRQPQPFRVSNAATPYIDATITTGRGRCQQR